MVVLAQSDDAENFIAKKDNICPTHTFLFKSYQSIFSLPWFVNNLYYAILLKDCF